MQELRSTDPYQSPFDDTTSGFFDGWWVEAAGAVSRDPALHHLGFSIDAVEVARATVKVDAEFADVFETFDPTRRTLDIELIETRATHQRRGIGSAVVALIRERWSHFQVVAVSYHADDFWRGIGFRQAQRNDNGQGYPLFVAPPLSPERLP